MPPLPSPVAGLRFRNYAGDSDLAHFTAVYNAARFADGLSGTETVEEFTNRYHHLTNCDLDRDLVVIETGDGRVVGYSRVTWWVEEATRDRNLFWLIYLLQEARLPGVEAALISWLESRLLEIAAERPHDGKSYFVTDLEQGQDHRAAALAAAGYRQDQAYAEMTRPLSDPIPDLPLPEGVEVRPTTAADIRAVWEADDRAFRDHHGYARQTEDDFLEFRNSTRTDPSLWMVAFSGDAIVGQVLNYVNHEDNAAHGRKWGWTESISVQREWRRRGVAQALITRSMAMWRDLGYDHAALGVHTTNPNGAFPLYEGLGYRVTRIDWTMRKDLPT